MFRNLDSASTYPRHCAALAVAAWFLLGPQVAGAGVEGVEPAVEPNAEALALAEGLRTHRLGVDRFGNLWSLNRDGGSVQVLTTAASLLLSTRLEHATAIDFDREWGLVALHRTGRQIQLYGPDGSPRHDFDLPDIVADVIWIDGGRVAVSPMRLDHRVQVWDVVEGRELMRWGNEEPVPERLGMSRQHEFLLDYDHARELLATFDTYWGDLQVFDNSGERVTHHRLGFADPEREKGLAEWLRQNDERMKSKVESAFTTLSHRVGIAVGRGGVWLQKSCARDAEGELTAIDLVRIALPSPEESVREESVTDTSLEAPPCCATHLVLWGRNLILYFEAGNPTGPCSWSKEVLDVD